MNDKEYKIVWTVYDDRKETWKGFIDGYPFHVTKPPKKDHLDVFRHHVFAEEVDNEIRTLMHCNAIFDAITGYGGPQIPEPIPAREVIDQILASADNRLNNMRQEWDALPGEEITAENLADYTSRQSELQDFRDHIVDQYGEEE